MRFIHPLTNFSSGELSENLFGRIDVQEYQSGLNPLILIVIPLLRNKDNIKISSTLIREKIK